MATDLGELLVPYMPTVRVPRTGDRVFKSECAFSFDSPVSLPGPSRTRTHTHAGGGWGVSGWGCFAGFLRWEIGTHVSVSVAWGRGG